MNELSIYERLCEGCPSEKRCHEECEYCDEYEEALNEEEKKELKAEVFIKYDDILNKPIKDFTEEDWKKHNEFIKEIDAIDKE